MTLQGLGFIPVAKRSQRIGPYEITSMTYEAYGHRGTGQSLHYHGPSGRLLVTRELGTFELNPQDPSSVLFEQCSNGARPECGIHYFDGRLTRSWKVSDEQVIRQPVQQPVAWSADGRAVVLSGEDHLQIVNLETPRTIDMSEALDLREGPAGRSVQFGEWSPDSRKIMLIVSQYTDLVPPFINVAQDLIVADVYGGSASYIATAEGRNWRALGYRWVPAIDGYAIATVPNARGIGWKVYRKGIADLPPGLTAR
ncbi:MAG: hypothetical protein ACT4P6_23285 [Gemmatimonadaceae bacterium]